MGRGGKAEVDFWDLCRWKNNSKSLFSCFSRKTFSGETEVSLNQKMLQIALN